MFDVLIRGGRVVDGTGTPWYRADVGIQGGEIGAVGRLEGATARRVLEVGDQVVAPGFIDAHLHSDLTLLEGGHCDGSLVQGVTTHIIGQDGVSYAPLTSETRPFLERYFAAINGGVGLAFDWESVDEFLSRFDGASALNVAYLVPHGTVRAAVMGHVSRAPDPNEIRRMQLLIERGLEQGAIGVSTGLDYLPCLHAGTDELIEIARPAAPGGVFVTHMRDYVDGATAAIEETLRVGEEAGLPVHISHFNCKAAMLAEIDRGRDRGIEVTFDGYPYLAGSTVLMLVLPRDLHFGTTAQMVEKLRRPEGKRALEAWVSSSPYSFEDMVLANLRRPEHQRFVGMNVAEAAELSGHSRAEFIGELLIGEEMAVGVVLFQRWRGEEDLIAVTRHPAHMVGSDGIYVGGRPHPRGWGAFARFLGRYVREQNILTLEEMIRHMTAAPATRFGLSDRGLLRPGMAADITVFDPETVTDTATYEDSRRLAEGVSYVFVNGELAVEDGKITGARPGRALRG
ncbi:MAG: D-aminoacylase [Trueperaceae bacterium]|nr:MAG: D-aminoacylase [Trueperaceae bacterium]